MRGEVGDADLADFGCGEEGFHCVPRLVGRGSVNVCRVEGGEGGCTLM